MIKWIFKKNFTFFWLHFVLLCKASTCQETLLTLSSARRLVVFIFNFLYSIIYFSYIQLFGRKNSTRSQSWQNQINYCRAQCCVHIASPVYTLHFHLFLGKYLLDLPVLQYYKATNFSSLLNLKAFYRIKRWLYMLISTII